MAMQWLSIWLKISISQLWQKIPWQEVKKQLSTLENYEVKNSLLPLMAFFLSNFLLTLLASNGYHFDTLWHLPLQVFERFRSFYSSSRGAITPLAPFLDLLTEASCYSMILKFYDKFLMNDLWRNTFGCHAQWRISSRWTGYAKKWGNTIGFIKNVTILGGEG